MWVSEEVLKTAHTDDDTTNLEVVDSLRPGLVANDVAVPAVGECSLQQRSDIANGEQDVTKGTVSVRWAT